MPQDLRDAWRSLSAAKTVAVAAMLSLALGIAATTAVFSLLFALLFRPLPVVHPEQLIVVASSVRQSVWIELRDRKLLTDGFAWFWNRMNVAASGEKDFVSGIAATGGLFGTLGVAPLLGRPL